MAWTAPTDRTTGDIITAAQWNTFLGATGDMSLTATGIVTTQGDMVYATAANTLARLAKGTAYQALAMNAGATAPSWQASPTSALTTTGDVLYASAANTLARLAIGSTSQVLTVTAGVPSWATASTTGSTVPTTTTGQILFASATNVLSALAVGTAYQALAMNSGATLPTWQASPTSVLIAQGDILYATAANTLARLPKGTAGQALVMNSGATAPEWGSVSAILKVSGAGFEVLPTRAAGAVALTSGTGTVYGSYGEVRGASGNAIYITQLQSAFIDTGSNYMSYMFGTGGAASETAVSEIGNLSANNTTLTGVPNVTPTPLWPWIAVAASTRIALKAADQYGTRSHRVKLNVIDQTNVV